MSAWPALNGTELHNTTDTEDTGRDSACVRGRVEGLFLVGMGPLATTRGGDVSSTGGGKESVAAACKCQCSCDGRAYVTKR